MKRLMILTAAVCLIAAATGCSDRSRSSRTIETLPNEPVEAAAQNASEETGASEADETIAATKTAETVPAEFEADEKLNPDLVGTWKYTYDEGMDAYYIIDDDHSLISMIDISQVLHTQNGKLVLGTEKDAAELSFRRKKGHYIAKSEDMVFLDLVPREGADTETMEGDFDLYQSVIFPQEEEESEGEDENQIQSHLVIRFIEDQASLMETGICYSSEEQLVFMTNKKKLLVNYHFEKDNTDVLILEEAEGDITLKRITSLDNLSNSTD